MRNKSSIKSYSICLVLLISVFSFNALAQENGIIELKFETTIKKTPNKAVFKNASKKGKSMNKQRGDFNNLVHKLHSTVYVENGIVKTTYGNSPIVKMTLEDANSIKSLNLLMSKYSEVKLLTVNLNSISDLNRILNLDAISEKSNLKFVFIKGRFNCDENRLNKFIKRKNLGIRVFYLCAESE